MNAPRAYSSLIEDTCRTTTWNQAGRAEPDTTSQNDQAPRRTDSVAQQDPQTLLTRYLVGPWITDARGALLRAAQEQRSAAQLTLAWGRSNASQLSRMKQAVNSVL
jgi:hypothetical protein